MPAPANTDAYLATLPPELIADIVARRIEQDEGVAAARAAKKKR